MHACVLNKTALLTVVCICYYISCILSFPGVLWHLYLNIEIDVKLSCHKGLSFITEYRLDVSGGVRVWPRMPAQQGQTLARFRLCLQVVNTGLLLAEPHTLCCQQVLIKGQLCASDWGPALAISAPSIVKMLRELQNQVAQSWVMLSPATGDFCVFCVMTNHMKFQLRSHGRLKA